jgi:hypothetical protein
VWVCGGMSGMDAATEPTRTYLRRPPQTHTGRGRTDIKAGCSCSRTTNSGRAEPGATDQQATGNRQQAISGKRQAASGKRQAASIRHQVTANKQNAGNKKPGAGPGFLGNLWCCASIILRRLQPRRPDGRRVRRRPSERCRQRGSRTSADAGNRPDGSRSAGPGW